VAGTASVVELLCEMKSRRNVEMEQEDDAALDMAPSGEKLIGEEMEVLLDVSEVAEPVPLVGDEAGMDEEVDIDVLDGNGSDGGGSLFDDGSGVDDVEVSPFRETSPMSAHRSFSLSSGASPIGRLGRSPSGSPVRSEGPAQSPDPSVPKSRPTSPLPCALPAPRPRPTRASAAAASRTLAAGGAVSGVPDSDSDSDSDNDSSSSSSSSEEEAEAQAEDLPAYRSKKKKQGGYLPVGAGDFIILREKSAKQMTGEVTSQ